MDSKIKREKTKIVATLGPSTSNYEMISQLVEAGASMFRLNTSHGTEEGHAANIEIIRKISQETGKYIPILIDLQGPKIRVKLLMRLIIQIFFRSTMKELQMMLNPAIKYFLMTEILDL